MKKSKLWKMLAAAGSFAVLASCQAILKPYAGIMDGGTGYMVSEPGECRRLLMEMVSSASGRERHEFYVTGEDYVPETLIIAQMFPEAVNISNTVIREYTEEGKQYVTCRIGFERRPKETDCNHKWETQILETGTCLWGQKEMLTCNLCGLEKTVFLAPPGHVNEDGDSLCDRCGDRIDKTEEAEKRFWAVGDIRSLEIGGKTYWFRCVDDDYRGENSNHQKCALFLCNTVIRSDVDSTDSKREILSFGETNNYKASKVRAWLLTRSEENSGELVPVNTGVNSAFFGQTGEGAYAEAAETELVKMELPVQVTMDRLFLLSLEEALEYRDELWNTEGEVSSYSRGYWLRTPVFDGGSDGKFVYGDQEYAVDLERGLIGPAKISDVSMGIRPAFCLPQA